MERSFTSERMDQPGLDAKCHIQALRGLGRLNAASLSARSTWRAAHRLLRNRSRPAGPISILDLASGGGDVTLALYKHAISQGYEPTIRGLDMSDTAVDYARSRVPSGYRINFSTADVLCDRWPVDGADLVVSTLFLHHLSEADAREMLRKMAQSAGIGIVVNDLRRSRIGYALASVSCRLLSRSPVVHADGPQSVGNAYTIEEAEQLAQSAGLASCRVAACWPYRYLLTHQS